MFAFAPARLGVALSHWATSACHEQRRNARYPVGALEEVRAWGYAQLAERVERDHGAHDCLEHVEGIAPDGTVYQMEFNVFWDDKRYRDVRVCGDLSAEPQRPLLGFISVYTSDVTDSFIMSPDGRFACDGGGCSLLLMPPQKIRH